jgi:hypothetical protein
MEAEDGRGEPGGGPQVFLPERTEASFFGEKQLTVL